jgi:2-dehydrotetronate isomerase
MPKFAANLSMLYTELPFLDRFEAAAKDGFNGVEFLFPYAWPAADIAARLRAHGLRQVLFNAPPGGGADPAAIAGAWERGERGTACVPGRQDDFQAGVLLALDVAQALDCPRLHLMAGVLPQPNDRAAAHRTYVDNLRWAAARALQTGREVLIEPINTRDMPGYFLHLQEQAHALLDEVGAPNLKVQMDLYHCQVMEGDVATKLRRYLPTGRVAHLQVAGVPGRNEPSVGELDCDDLFGLVDELRFDGWVGCEYRPQRGAAPGATTAGLGWMQRWR